MRSPLLLPCLLFGSFVQARLFPVPPGSANVHITHYPYTDSSREEPFAEGCGQPRRLMLTLYQPATCEQTETITYLPPRTVIALETLFGQYLPKISLSNFELQVCPEASENRDVPLLLYSPGGWAPRGIYAAMLQWVASLGFNILSVDHPYDATMVEYPDSTYVEYTKNYTFSNDVLTFLAPRVEDMSSVLKIVTNRTLSQQIGLPELNTERIAVFGHSLGGATAVGALLAEPRLEAACNIDGGLWGEEITTNNSRPFMLITAADHPDSDTSWWENWPYQLGRKWHLDIEGAAHNTFTDFSILYKLLGTNMTDPAVEAVMGTIDPIRVFTILRDYIGAFFFDILAGKDDDLLKGPSPDYPDVTFRNMSSGGNQ